MKRSYISYGSMTVGQKTDARAKNDAGNSKGNIMFLHGSIWIWLPKKTKSYGFRTTFKPLGESMVPGLQS